MFRFISTFSKTIFLRLIICLLSFFVFNSAFPQQKNAVIEDDYEILKGKIHFYFNRSDDRAMTYAKQMAKSSNDKHLAFANGAMTVFFQTKGNTKESQKRYKAALYYLEKMSESDDKTHMKSYVYNYGGIAELSRGNYSKALENFETALKNASKMFDIKQIVKIQGNVALLNERVGNYQVSIKNLKNLIDFVNENKNVFTELELLNYKSNFNLGLGSAYESDFMKNLNKRYLLDSAEYYYRKTITYSQNFINNKITAQLSLGNAYNWKKDFKSAEKMYFDVIFLARQNNDTEGLRIGNYNLGDVYYSTKKYHKALVFYKKSDTLSKISGNELNIIDYLKSNFYQAKIYTILKQPELAYKHSKIYLDNYEKYEAKISKEALEVNYKQGVGNLTTEMHSIEKKYKQDLFLTRALYVFYLLLFIGSVFLLIKNIRDKNYTRKNTIALLEESNAKKTESIKIEL